MMTRLFIDLAPPITALPDMAPHTHWPLKQTLRCYKPINLFALVVAGPINHSARKRVFGCGLSAQEMLEPEDYFYR